MRWAEKALLRVQGPLRSKSPSGTIKVVDRSPLNWRYITCNTVEELVRVRRTGLIRTAAMESWSWVDDRTLQIELRADERFPDGEPLTAATVKRSFEEMMRWRAPHPPGTHFNLDPRTICVVVDDRTVRFELPEPDGLALGKLRAMHLMSTRFWDSIGFGYARDGTGEGHW